MARAITRGQEGLSQEETIKAYHTIYFPAQEIHFVQDNPRQAAVEILINDPDWQTHIGCFSKNL